MTTTIGSYPLFLGVETAGWTLQDFQHATAAAKAAGMTSLLVKVADGGNMWYGSVGGYQAVLQTIEQAGLPAIAYTYCYGDTFGALTVELNILTSIMQARGIVIADMEAEYNGRMYWATQLCNALKPLQGIFGVTTWANPNNQSWQAVLSALRPCVDFWLPQVYSNYLASVYQGQYDAYGVTYYPVLNLGSDMGPNDIVSIAQAAKGPVLGFWEYQGISAYATQLQQIIAGRRQPMSIPTGWHDDGKTLTAPNGIPITDGFRTHVLSQNWHPDNIPLQAAQSLAQLEISNPALGAGVWQPFNWTVLEWLKSSNQVIEAYAGKELLVTRQKLSQAITALNQAQQQSSDTATVTTLESKLTQINVLSTQIATLSKL